MLTKGAAGVHAEGLRCSGGLGVNGSHGHAGMEGVGTGPLRDFDAGRWPVEGLRHEHVDIACGTRLFLPQPLLHALKHIVEEIITSVLSIFHDFCRHWFPSLMPEVISSVLLCSKHVDHRINTDPDPVLLGHCCHMFYCCTVTVLSKECRYKIIHTVVKQFHLFPQLFINFFPCLLQHKIPTLKLWLNTLIKATLNDSSNDTSRPTSPQTLQYITLLETVNKRQPNHNCMCHITLHYIPLKLYCSSAGRPF